MAIETGSAHGTFVDNLGAPKPGSVVLVPKWPTTVSTDPEYLGVVSNTIEVPLTGGYFEISGLTVGVWELWSKFSDKTEWPTFEFGVENGVDIDVLTAAPISEYEHLTFVVNEAVAISAAQSASAALSAAEAATAAQLAAQAAADAAEAPTATAIAAVDADAGSTFRVQQDARHMSTYEPLKGADDNYITDAEKTKLANLSGTNTGDQDLSPYLTSAAAASAYAPLSGQFATHTLTAAASVTLSADYPAQSLAMTQNTTLVEPTISDGAAILLWLSGAFTPTWWAGIKWAGGTPATYDSGGTLYHLAKQGAVGWLGSGQAYS